MSEAVCNGGYFKGKPKASKIHYPLESALRNLGTVQGAYVIAIFDCCREYLSDAMRGGLKDDNDGLVDCEVEDYSNVIIWFGCGAGSKVDATSTIASEFFEQVQKAAIKRNDNGNVILPVDLMKWHPGGGGGETSTKITHDLKLNMDPSWQPLHAAEEEEKKEPEQTEDVTPDPNLELIVNIEDMEGAPEVSGPISERPFFLGYSTSLFFPLPRKKLAIVIECNEYGNLRSITN